MPKLKRRTKQKIETEIKTRGFILEPISKGPPFYAEALKTQFFIFQQINL